MIGFIIGVFVGVIFGVVIMALLSFHKQGEFGKTVFLTREEAEQALKEREENA